MDDGTVLAAWIGAAVSITAALVGAWTSVMVGNRQRSADLIAAALNNMGGRTQPRSAGLAALMAMRGHLDKQPSISHRWSWNTYGQAVGQQLFRQLVYLLSHRSEEYSNHEIENIIAMMNWLTSDKYLEFTDSGQRQRLNSYLSGFEKGAASDDPSVKSALNSVGGWRRELESKRQ
jgi:hypothetical protein